LFVYEQETDYDFVLMLPFRQVNMQRVAGTIQTIEPAYRPEREDYDATHEMLVLRGVGNQEQALEQMNTIMQNTELTNRLTNVDYKVFVVTPDNLNTLQEGKYINEYMTFFTNNFLRGLKGETGIEDGDFRYNQSVNHKFVLLYSNKIDPFKLKTEFEKVNYTGLTLNNSRYDGEYDCLTISGFNDKATAMRYFNMVIKNNDIYKLLRNTDFRNFVASDYNFGVLKERQLANEYLVFFKKYYLD
jgi:hypothetical protein